EQQGQERAAAADDDAAPHQASDVEQPEDGAEILQGEAGDEARRKAEHLARRLVGNRDQPGHRGEEEGERQDERQALQDQRPSRDGAAHPNCTFWSARRMRWMKTSAISAMATIIRLAIAAAAPMSKNSSPCLTASNISTVVASLGPPLVVAKTMSKTRNASIPRSTSARKIEGSIIGSATRRSRCR